MPTISDYKRQRVIELKAEGLSQRRISTVLSLSRCGVQKIIKKHQIGISLKNRPKIGRPSKLSITAHRHIAIESKRDPKKTAREIRNSLNLNDVVSINTIKRVLCNADLHGRVSCRKPSLSIKNKMKRRVWCNNKLEWSVTDWGRVIYTDETKIEINPMRRNFARRPSNKRYDAKYITGTNKFSPSLMLWGAVRADGKRVLIRCNGSVNQEEYQRVLGIGLPQIYSTRYMFMQDGATCHTARSTCDYLREKAVRMLEDWPAQSPDLNIIEHVWDFLKEKVKCRHPSNLEELWRYSQEEFANISNHYITKLYQSLPQRVRYVVAAKGGSTKY